MGCSEVACVAGSALMARLRRPERVAPGGVPMELTSRFHPLWEDPDAVEALAVEHGLMLDPGQFEWTSAPAAVRFDAFRRSWCEAQGLMHPKWPTSLDHSRVREAGVDTSGSSRYRLRSTGRSSATSPAKA